MTVREDFMRHYYTFLDHDLPWKKRTKKQIEKYLKNPWTYRRWVNKPRIRSYEEAQRVGAIFADQGPPLGKPKQAQKYYKKYDKGWCAGYNELERHILKILNVPEGTGKSAEEYVRILYNSYKNLVRKGFRVK